MGNQPRPDSNLIRVNFELLGTELGTHTHTHTHTQHIQLTIMAWAAMPLESSPTLYRKRVSSNLAAH